MPGASSEFLKIHRSHEIVRAGAGAGKTYTLTHRVMDIAEDHLARTSRLPRLIVTTFTRKATQELRERLMLLALNEKPHLIEFVNSRSNLVVSTLHGVMDLYLKRYGGSICIDPGYEIIGSGEAGKIARQTLRQILLTEMGTAAGDLLESFSFNRLVALVHRIGNLLGENPAAEPFRLADFERLFGKRALNLARDLESVAREIKDESVKADWLAMADEYLKLASILKAGDWPVNRDRFIAVVDAMKTARKNAKSPPVTDMTADEAQAVRERAKELRKPLYDPAAWTLFTERYELFQQLGHRFAEEFRATKIREGVLEIDDLELLAMDCIRRHPRTVEAFWKEWDHWLIDEYQDTSPFQVELLRALSGESPCFIVGDPQQSIYLFRGARSEVFGRKEEEILASGGDRRLLTVNRRSRPELLLFLNDVFSRFDPPFQPMEPFLQEGQIVEPGYLVATIFAAREEDVVDAITDADTGADVSADMDSEVDGKSAREMRAIVVHVQGLLASGARPEEICVLARTNRVLGEVATWLNRYRLPTHVHAASGFYDRREIRDALALLKFLVNPHDGSNLIELLRAPWFRMPDDALVEIARRRPESLWESLLAERSMSDEFQAVARLQRLLENTRIKGISETFKDALVEEGFIDLAHIHDVSGRRESNIWKLLARLQEAESRPGFNPLAFVASTFGELQIEAGNTEGDAVAAVEPDRINLMTIHASKGLEFRHVLLPRMDQRPRLTTNEEFTFDEEAGRWALRVPFGEDRDMIQSLPEALWLERFQRQELEEHARVLYVALTRAVDSVFLSWTGQPQKQAWAGMMGLDLKPGEHKTASYTYRVLEEEPTIAEAPAIESAVATPRSKWREPLPIEPGPLRVREGTRAQKAVSVTRLLERKAGLDFISGTDPHVARRLKVASEGTAMHRLMELLKYPSQDRLGLLVRKWFPGQEDRILAGIEFVRECRKPPLLELIARGAVEWGFSIIEDGALIEGQIDLWGRTDAGEVWIVDYKTGSPEFRRKAFDQMALYALALRKSGQARADEEIRLAAVYPFAREIFTELAPPRERVRELFGISQFGISQ